MVQSGEFNTSSKSSQVASPEMAGLYASYALILFAVPTFGVAAAVGLLRIWTKAIPSDPVMRSHYIYQRRTLLASVVAVVAGALLIIINVGVFVLFAMSVWTIVRGAVGLKTLLEGQPIRQPMRLFY